jgi:C-terminal processing protease CtpA/Prc
MHMKKIAMLGAARMALVAVVAIVVLAGCQSEEEKYVRKAVKLMDKRGLFAEGAAWEEARAVALAERPATREETYDVVRQALKVAGGKHSFIMTVEQQQHSAVEDAETAPSVALLEDGIAVITLPAFSGQNNEENRRYVSAVLDALPETVPGAVIDLRGNTGGNMYPMIAAVHRFLPDDTILRFKSRKYTQPITKAFILQCVNVEAQPQIDCPVALLTDDMTASSGEALLLCFRGLENARTFGTPTAGYASANTPILMPDGSKLVLTTGCDVARTGELFCDDPIAPDVATPEPLEAALSWLRNR